MSSKIWNKYKILKEINIDSNIKTYLTRIEPIIKEIMTKDKDEYNAICDCLHELKNEIFEIIEENNKIFIVLENNKDLMERIDNLIKSKNIIKEIEIKDKNIITKEEIMNLFKMEKSMCKIKTEIIKKINYAKEQLLASFVN